MENRSFCQAFGPHLVIDGFGCPREVLEDAERAKRFLLEAPDAIGMTRISPPIVVVRPDGLSGFVIIAESHITVHTYAARGEVRLDLFSCREFDAELAVAVSREAFDFKRSRVRLFRRGLEFPSDVEAVTDFVLQERQAVAL